MEQFKSKKVFLTEEEIIKCQEDMMQFASKEEKLELELEKLNEEHKSKKKGLETEAMTAKVEMRKNVTLINQKFKYVDVPYKIFSDNELKKEFHTQTDTIELLETFEVAPFANPELEFSNYCVIIIDSENKADEIYESNPELYSQYPVNIPIPETDLYLEVYQNEQNINIVRFSTAAIAIHWAEIIERAKNDIQDNEDSGTSIEIKHYRP